MRPGDPTTQKVQQLRRVVRGPGEALNAVRLAAVLAGQPGDEDIRVEHHGVRS